MLTNKTKEVEPESRSNLTNRTIQLLVKDANQNQDQSISAKQWGNRKRSRHVIKTENCAEDLMNSIDWTPRILHNQLRFTLTHTPALSIHNGRNYQELKREKEKERDTRKIEGKRERKSKKNPEKCMLWQSVATCSRPQFSVRRNWIGYYTHLRWALRSTTVGWEREKERDGGGGRGRE